MCILCTFAGKVSGGLECSDAGNQSTETNVDTYAPQPAGEDGATSESSGADSVLGSTSTSDTLSIDSFARGFVNSAGDQSLGLTNACAIKLRPPHRAAAAARSCT